MVQPFEGRWRCVVCDSAYTSVPIARLLLDENTFMIGAVRAKRKYVPWPALDMPTSPKGDFKIAKRGDVYFTAWHDVKVVTILSTGCPVTPTHVVKRWVKKGEDGHERV